MILSAPLQVAFWLVTYVFKSWLLKNSGVVLDLCPYIQYLCLVVLILNSNEMKVKFGAIVTDGRGKIGGHVMSKNKGGSYMRTKKSPANPKSSYQQTVRARLTSNAQGWRGLTAAQIVLWNTAAKLWYKHNVFGDKRNPNGFNLYLWLSNNLSNIGAALLTIPPVAAAVGMFTSVSVTMANGTPACSIVFAPAIDANSCVIIRATPGISRGKTYIKNQLRQIGIMVTANTTPFNALTMYTGKYGAIPAVGSTVFFTGTWVNKTTGQAGQTVPFQVTIAS
jgi:hypothetical protein